VARRDVAAGLPVRTGTQCRRRADGQRTRRRRGRYSRPDRSRDRDIGRAGGA
jgi:hypothetical protein